MLLNNDYLLATNWARKLFHGYAEHMPIIDYHCHLDPAQIYEDKRFENLTEVWLFDHGAGDHYKWRLLRANGTDEKFITGDGDDYTKYLEFVKAIERAIGNPMYEWSHAELRRAFGIELTINQKNARAIWDAANDQLSKPEFSAKGLIRRFDVRCICTTDNPVSDLRYHKLLAKQETENGFKVLPAFRPDDLLDINLGSFSDYVKTLSAVSNIDVEDYDSLKQAVAQRVDYFHSVGGRLADHGMNTFHYTPASEDAVSDIVGKALSGARVSPHETAAYQTEMTRFLMGEYEHHGWTLQLHANCSRNDSTRNLRAIGKDAGFDSVGVQSDLALQLKELFDAAQQDESLPKCIVYSLNDADWLSISSMCGSFQGGVKQRMQFGNAWWFNDTFTGMSKQLTIFAEQGLLANFTGMLTDSRSFLSYPRHEYFRRVLCNVLGEFVERGSLPEDEAYLGTIVEDICYNNAHDYFGFFSAGQ